MGATLEGKNAVVTGAGRGIGKAIALVLASEGARVVVNDVGVDLDGTGSTTSSAKEVAAEIQATGKAAVANYDSVADFGGAEKIIKSCVDSFGSIDILVNAAGILRDRMIWNMTAEEWDAVIKVHLYGTFNTCRHASGLMRQQRNGRIINIASRGALGVSSGNANYAAAKGGIVSFTRCIARDMGRYGITANVVMPAGWTRMTQSIPEDKLREMAVRIWGMSEAEVALLSKDELGKKAIGDPMDAGCLIAYLASEEAANINGQLFFCGMREISRYHDPALPERTIYTPKERWTVEDVYRFFPGTVGSGLVNPAPPY